MKAYLEMRKPSHLVQTLTDRGTQSERALTFMIRLGQLVRSEGILYSIFNYIICSYGVEWVCDLRCEFRFAMLSHTR